LGSTALAALVRELHYVIDVDGASREVLADAATGLLGADRLPRQRSRGTREGTFDLRPRVLELAVEPTETSTTTTTRLRLTARVDPALGVGRPDDVIDALSDAVGASLMTTRLVRTRVRLADE
ncbi:MAG TPA: hypothetical protein VGK63_05725, partial [Candidatus Limnocylindrales bacterium]